MSHLTILDQEIVHYTLFRLASFWPFYDAHRTKSYIRVGNEKTEQYVKSFVDEEKGSEVQLHLTYGWELDKQNRFDEALAEYKAALAIQPIAETYNRLGCLYLKKTEIEYRTKKDYKNALQSFAYSDFYFTKGLTRWPLDLELNYNIGLLYFMRADKLMEAEKYFLTVLGLNSHHKHALQNLSEMYIRLKRFEEAKNILKKGIEQYPSYARFYTNLGIVFIQENQLQEAKNCFERAIEIDNDQQARFYISKLQAHS
jgi:tetratricopeptide (TPR) repeat protein